MRPAAGGKGVGGGCNDRPKHTHAHHTGTRLGGNNLIATFFSPCFFCYWEPARRTIRRPERHHGNVFATLERRVIATA